MLTLLLALPALASTTTIDFDDGAAPCTMAAATALRGTYAPVGVAFSGLGPLDGGAIIDECGGFAVQRYTSPNFLAFNSTNLLSDGGIPAPPETLTFTPPATRVAFGIGSSLNGTATVTAFDAAGAIVDSASVPMASKLVTVELVGVEIATVEVTATATYWVMDDLSFDSDCVDPVDSDGDGVGDACERCPGADDKVDVDADGWPACLDCDDVDAAIHPESTETADGRDEDCDGTVDEGTDWYDDDGDGVTEAAGDCDDNNPRLHPGAVETCDGANEDCDGFTDEGTPCADDDGDGWSEIYGDCADGDPNVGPGQPEIEGDGIDQDCDGIVDPASIDGDGDGVGTGDCAPEDPGVFPGNAETADGIDEDCDGIVDEGTSAHDDDGDGISEDEGDCDDSDAAIFPGATETADGRDEDCDLAIDEDTTPPDDTDGDPDDADGDGWTAAGGDCDDADGWSNPDQDEICDGADNDCDGVVDGEVCAEDAADGGAPEDGGCGCAGVQGAGSAWITAALLILGRRRGWRPR